MGLVFLWLIIERKESCPIRSRILLCFGVCNYRRDVGWVVCNLLCVFYIRVCYSILIRSVWCQEFNFVHVHNQFYCASIPNRLGIISRKLCAESRKKSYETTARIARILFWPYRRRIISAIWLLDPSNSSLSFDPYTLIDSNEPPIGEIFTAHGISGEIKSGIDLWDKKGPFPDHAREIYLHY